MIHKRKNFRLLPPEGISSDDIFEDCNLMQKYPHTLICPGISGLIFRQCNLSNCNLPVDAKINDCGQVHRHKSRCSNLHPEWNLSPLCPIDCSHVVDKDEIIIDGKTVVVNYFYQDREVA